MNPSAYPASTTRLVAIDALRGLAAFLVLIYHYIYCYVPLTNRIGTILDPIAAVAKYGFLGVNLFFMISGFVILWSVKDRSSSEFVISRASRLYPTFWVSMCLTALTLLIAGTVLEDKLLLSKIDSATLLANATMMPQVFGLPRIDGVYWTLEFELRFYFLVFLAVALRQMARIELHLYVWLLLCFAAQFMQLPWIMYYFALLPYGPLFICGGVLYLIYDRGTTPYRLTALVTSTYLSAVNSESEFANFAERTSYSSTISMVVVVGFVTLLTFVVLGTRRVTNSALYYRLGELTYPLYLTHAAIGAVFIRILQPLIGSIAAVVITAIFAILLAQLLVVVVDEPARRPTARAMRHVWGTTCALIANARRSVDKKHLDH